MQPHKSKLFKLLETPYLSNLKLALDLSLNRPVTVHNKQRYLVFKFHVNMYYELPMN